MSRYTEQQNEVYQKYKDKWMKEQLELRKKVINKDDFDFEIFPEIKSKTETHNIFGTKHEVSILFKDKNEKINTTLKKPLKYIGGVDISPIKPWHWNINKACAGIIIVEYPSLKVVHKEMKIIELTQPYVSGFLAFRECEPLVGLIENIKKNYPIFIPQLIIVDGNGYWHYRRMGLASHLGAVTGIPTLGCAKRVLQVERGMQDVCMNMNDILREIGEYKIVKTNDNEILGAALKTCKYPKKHDYEESQVVYVSSGHRISLNTSLKLCYLTLAPKQDMRLPLPTELADGLTRDIMREYEQKTKDDNIEKGLLNEINDRIEKNNRQNYQNYLQNLKIKKQNENIKKMNIDDDNKDNSIQIYYPKPIKNIKLRKYKSNKMNNNDNDNNNNDYNNTVIVCKIFRFSSRLLVTFSALCIIPPNDIWSPIQTIRSQHDKSYIRWMPHINLFFPFIKPNEFDLNEIKNELKLAFKKFNVKSERISLTKFNCFEHIRNRYSNRRGRGGLGYRGRGSYGGGYNRYGPPPRRGPPFYGPPPQEYMFLEPNNKEFLNKLYKCLCHVLPDCVQQRNRRGNNNNNFTPHLTVGQFDEYDIIDKVDHYNRSWTPKSFKVNQISWVIREQDTPFRVYQNISL